MSGGDERVRSAVRRRSGGRYSVAYLAHKLRTFADVSVFRRASARVASGRTGAVSVPINLFDIMTVVARREESLP